MSLPLAAVTEAGPCNATLKWSWDGASRDPARPYVATSLLVVQLTDDDGNGRIDAGDVPDVVFGRGGFADTILTAIEGRSGADIFSTDPAIPLSSEIAAGDLDGDGVVELLASHANRTQVVAFEHDGSVRWLSDALPASDPFTGTHLLALADFDQDGSPEIYAGGFRFSATGRLERTIPQPASTGEAFGWSLPTAVDLLPGNGQLELLAGNTLYDAQGVVWSNASLEDGWTAVADFDGDGEPEILLQVDGARTFQPPALYLLDRQGNPLAPRYEPGARCPPTVADLDGDGPAEAVIDAQNEIVALDWIGGAFSAKWRVPVNNSGHSAIQSSAYDFDGDGAAEVLHVDNDWLYLLDGATGAVREQVPTPGWRGLSSFGPITADVDADCLPDILYVGQAGQEFRVMAYGCDQGQPARAIWNQAWYHVTNINDDGTVPRVEDPPWTASNSCHAQAASSPRAVPGSAGNTLLAVRSGGSVVISWGVAPGGARSYTLHRGTVKGVWPAPPFMPGLAARTATLNDVPSPPPLYFYRVAGANCAGVEGP